jgi:hypothetical protein
MEDEDYDDLAREQVGDLFELNREASGGIDDLIEGFAFDLKIKIEELIKPSALDLASHAFAMIYKNADFWLLLDNEDGPVIEVSFGDGFPSIFRDFNEVVSRPQFGLVNNDLIFLNIDKAILSLEQLRGEIKKYEEEEQNEQSKINHL